MPIERLTVPLSGRPADVLNVYVETDPRTRTVTVGVNDVNGAPLLQTVLETLPVAIRRKDALLIVALTVPIPT